MTRMFTALCAAAVLCGAVLGTTLHAQESARKPAAVTAAAPVNLNTATVAQLDALPGIGKATAERIVEYRQKNGGFKKPEDLMNVRGVGEKSFLKLKPLITVAPGRQEHSTQQ